jgi:hypothetical protein
MPLKEIPFESLWNFSMPTPIFNLVLVEGVDHPFFTRLEGEEAIVPLQRERRSTKVRAAGSVFYNGLSFPVFDSSPNEEPITNGKVTYTPIGNIVLRRERMRMGAYDAANVEGFYPFAIPATTYSVTVQQLIDEIRMHLLEPAGEVTWSLWTQTEVLTFIQQKVIRFLMETGIVRERLERAHNTGSGEVDLPEDLLDLRRVAWDGTALLRTDPFVLDHGTGAWYLGSGTPYTYIEEPRDPLTIRIIPAPDANGTIAFIYIQPGIDVLSLYGVRDAHLPIPAAFCPHIKWGVLGDMLMKEGEAHDPVRADHCFKRYEEGVQLARLWMGAME